MPYNDDKQWMYEQEIPSSGSSEAIAAARIARDIESYLFDYNHPGYDRKEFLSWALMRYSATRQSSGNTVDKYLYWNPEMARHRVAGGPVEGETFHPRNFRDDGIRLPQHVMDNPDIDTDSDVEGDHQRVERYADASDVPFMPGEKPVLDPADARFIEGKARVVAAPPVPPAPEPPQDGDE